MNSQIYSHVTIWLLIVAYIRGYGMFQKFYRGYTAKRRIMYNLFSYKKLLKTVTIRCYCNNFKSICSMTIEFFTEWATLPVNDPWSYQSWIRVWIATLWPLENFVESFDYFYAWYLIESLCPASDWMQRKPFDFVNVCSAHTVLQSIVWHSMFIWIEHDAKNGNFFIALNINNRGAIFVWFWIGLIVSKV